MRNRTGRMQRTARLRLGSMPNISGAGSLIGVRPLDRNDPLATWRCDLRLGPTCVEVSAMSVGLRFGEGVVGFHRNSSCRPSRLLPTLMPSWV